MLHLALILTGAAIAVAGLSFLLAFLARRRAELRLRILEILGSATRRGLPLPGLFERAAEDHVGRRRQLFLDIADSLRHGTSLSEALEASPLAFPAHAIATLRASEGSSELPATLDSLSQGSARALEAGHRLSLAAIYPVLLCVVMVAVMKTLALLPSPLANRLWDPSDLREGLLAGMSVIGYLLAALLLSTFLVPTTEWRPARLRRLGAWLRDLLPPSLHPGRLLECERLLRALAALVHAGVPLPEAFRRAAPAAGSRRAAKAARRAALHLDSGIPVAKIWASAGLPKQVVTLAAAAATPRPAELAGTLRFLADRCAERFQARFDRVLACIYPSALLLFGTVLAYHFYLLMAALDEQRTESMLW